MNWQDLMVSLALQSLDLNIHTWDFIFLILREHERA